MQAILKIRTIWDFCFYQSLEIKILHNCEFKFILGKLSSLLIANCPYGKV